HATTLPDWKLREVEVGRMPGGPVLDFCEQKQTVTELRLDEQEITQEVVINESKPVTVIDPCTGCTRTEYQMCPVVKIVKVKVYNPVPVCKQVIVRVPVLKPGPEQIVRKLVVHETTIPAIARTLEAVTTQNEVHVAVPAPVCPLPA